MKLRTSELIKKEIMKSILEGEYSINEPLLPERELASKFRVGRPTVREALQGLERDGWISVRKGMPAVVNDYWTNGNLMTIVNILECYEEVPDIFIEYMLGLRMAITPTYIRDAVCHQPVKAIACFVELEDLGDEPEEFAVFDWGLQRNLAKLSPNPIYILFINSFEDIYVPLATKYFTASHYRAITRNYYHELLASILKGDLTATEQITRTMMKKSIQLWKERGE